MMKALLFRSKLIGIALLSLPSATLGQSTQTYVDLTGSLGYSRNPFLVQATDGAAFGRLAAFGVHSITSERGQTDFNAYVENSIYLRGYGSQPIFDLGVHKHYQISERVRIFGDAKFSGDIGGQLSGRFNNATIVPPATGTGGIETAPELSYGSNLDSLNRRQYRVLGQVGAAFTVSARDTLSTSASGQHVFFGSNGDNLNYTVASVNAGWQHQLTERNTAGVRVGLQRANYAGPENSTTVISPQLTFRTRFAEGWDADLAAGVSFVTQRTALGRGRSIGPAVNALVCRTTESERYCGRVSHSVQTVSGQNAPKVTSAGGDFFKRLSQRDTLQARIDVVRYSGGDSVTESSKAAYYSGALSLSRKLSDRLSAGGDFGARKYVRRDIGRIPSDLSISAFLRYRLGDAR